MYKIICITILAEFCKVNKVIKYNHVFSQQLLEVVSRFSILLMLILLFYRSLLLPDHSALELDLEAELNGPESLPPQSKIFPSTDSLPLIPLTDSPTPLPPLTDTPLSTDNPITPSTQMTTSTDSAIVASMTASGMTSSYLSDLTASVTAIMEGSTDSAIGSAPPSRSATASPVTALLQPTLRYAAAAALNKRKKSRVLAASLAHPLSSSSSPNVVSIKSPLHDLTQGLSSFPPGDKLSKCLSQSSRGDIVSRGSLTPSQGRPKYLPGLLSPGAAQPFHSASIFSALSMSNCDPTTLLTPESLEDFSLIERWLAGYPDSKTAESRASSFKRKSIKLDSSRPKNDKKSSLLGSSRLKRRPPESCCSPCSQCASVLETVSSLQGLHSALRITPCHEFSPCYCPRHSSNINRHSRANSSKSHRFGAS